MNQSNNYSWWGRQILINSLEASHYSSFLNYICNTAKARIKSVFQSWPRYFSRSIFEIKRKNINSWYNTDDGQGDLPATGDATCIFCHLKNVLVICLLRQMWAHVDCTWPEKAVDFWLIFRSDLSEFSAFKFDCNFFGRPCYKLFKIFITEFL